jgi:hypothetical protein
LSQLSDQHAQLLRQQEVLATELMVALGNYKPKANIDAGELLWIVARMDSGLLACVVFTCCSVVSWRLQSQSQHRCW